MEEEKEVIPGYKSVEDFTKVFFLQSYFLLDLLCMSQEGFKALMGAIKSSNALPSDKDFDFYKVHESFERLMNVNSDKLLGLMNNLLRKQGILHNFRSRGLEDKVELLVEANDVVLERAANGIDEMNGIKNNVSGESELQTVSTVLPINGSWNRSDKAKVSFGTSGGVEVVWASLISFIQYYLILSKKLEILLRLTSDLCALVMSKQAVLICCTLIFIVLQMVNSVFSLSLDQIRLIVLASHNRLQTLEILLCKTSHSKHCQATRLLYCKSRQQQRVVGPPYTRETQLY